MPDHSHDDRSTSGLLLGVAVALAGVAALIAVASFAARPQTTTSAQPGRSAPSAQPAPTAPPVPSTTMSPVRPDDESAGAEPSSSGVSAAWVDDVSRSTGISRVAVDAYGAASLRIADDSPACRLGWTTLAGIGRVESGHGTSDGARLRTGGTTSRKILGPALDGSAGLAAIRSDSRSMRWHGDDRWDHAMGPMQFIPSTWERWESDGNDDGTADPHNIYDAAYAAGRYL